MLTVETAVHSTGAEAVPVAFGWHPNLCIPEVPRADWRVALPVRRQAVLESRALPTGEDQDVTVPPGPPGERTYDDLYTALREPLTGNARSHFLSPEACPRAIRPPAYVLEGGGRRLTLAFGPGYPDPQVYAPPDSDVIAFEPMTAPTNALATGAGLRWVASGTTFAASFSLQVALT